MSELKGNQPIRCEPAALCDLEQDFLDRREPRIRTRVRGVLRGETGRPAESERERRIEVLFVVHADRRIVIAAARTARVQTVPEAEVDRRALEGAVARHQVNLQIGGRPHREA